MKEQLTKKVTEGQDSTFEDQYSELKGQALLRTVKVQYQSCCGCGCDTVWLNRVVPGDSPIQDGDEVDELMDDDNVLD